MSSVEVRRFAQNSEPHAAAPAELPADRLDADMRHVLTVLESMGGKRIEVCNSPEARALPTLDMALRRILRDQIDDMGVSMEMRLIDGHTGDLRARIYLPQNDIIVGPRPMILYFHGGGFVLGDVDQYDATPRALAARTGALVVSAHYRKAPEHRFPAAHEDAWAAWTWLNEHAAALGGDPKRAALVGEGSGANLAVNVALRAKLEGQAMPLHLGLVTPMAAMLFDLPSHLENKATFPYSTAALEWAARKLFRKKDEAHDVRMNVAGRLDLDGLPPATIILADADPLRSEGEALADAMRRSGVWVDETRYEGVTHGFFGLYRVVNKAMFAHGQLSRNLIAAFGG
ncbi:alpha/beta hydrolase [Devosia sp. ZB163]|uniref:alpha/beta hydrolase n=1 Tax=Devosia sp. ZB163 TaxID=3025938 RepID=UPI00235E114A|nr:alpha/beta hydrolase [Devosia sp. ZB163]MDC9822609.1 alpha/beta hydrolase [Devosia sp. ZB163]